MEDKHNGWHAGHNNDHIRGLSGDLKVPSSLLPGVLHSLGLTPEQTTSELSIDDLVAMLKSDDWKVRLAAVRLLGKLTDVPTELLVPALDDEDESVRAAAVHVLGKAGKRTSIDGLIAALYDADWHVRETAMLALGKQEQRIPDEAFMTALHDADGSVREAAMLAMQWNYPEERSFVWNGQRWEKKTMQQNEYDTDVANATSSRSMSEISLNDAWEGERAFAMQGQVQAYAPQEAAFYEYRDALSLPGEKLTVRRSPQKGWWIATGIAALLFFLLGAGVSLWLMPFVIHTKSMSVSPVKPFPFVDFKSSWIAENEIAAALHLTPQQITTQLRAGKSLTDIAAAQGVPAPELQAIELKAFTDSFDLAVKSGETSQQDADIWIQQLQHNPQLLEKLSVTLFLADPQPLPPIPTPQPTK